MIVTEKQMTAIHNRLEYGDKQKMADAIGVHKVTLSRYLNLQTRRNRRTREFESVYSMPTKVYNQIIDFLNQ